MVARSTTIFGETPFACEVQLRVGQVVDLNRFTGAYSNNADTINHGVDERKGMLLVCQQDQHVKY